IMASVLAASCSNAPLGSLSAGDLASGWGLQKTATTVPRSLMASLAHGPFGCKGSYLVLFTPPGKPFFQVNPYGNMSYREVASSASTCGSVPNTKHVFDQITIGSL